MGGRADGEPLLDCPMEDAEATVVGRPQGEVSPAAKEVVFLVEEVHFVHEVFRNLVLEGGRWRFAERGKLHPTEM